MFRNTRRKLSMLLAAIILAFSMPTEGVLAAGNDGLQAAEAADDLTTEENAEIETSENTAITTEEEEKESDSKTVEETVSELGVDAVYDHLYETEPNELEGTETTVLEAEPEVNVFSLLPLEEKTLSPDLTGLTPVERTMVSFDKIFAGEDMSGVKQIAYVDHGYSYEWSEWYNDDYMISRYPGTIDMSGDTNSTSYRWLMIPGGDQLDSAAVRYVVEPRYTDAEKWLVPTVYMQDSAGNRKEAETAFSYLSYSDSRRMNVNVTMTNETVAQYYLKFDINSEIFPKSDNRDVLKIYEGSYDTAEEAQKGRDITSEIYGSIDMSLPDAGYAVDNLRYITIVSYDKAGSVTGCLPIMVSFGLHSNSNHISTGSLFKLTDDGREYVTRNSLVETEGAVITYTCELYEGYAANDTYYFTMAYYRNGKSDNSAVTAAYAGNYATIAKAEGAGAQNIKSALFSDNYDTAGYQADYSKGVHFSIFVGNDGEGQEAYHYCIKAKEGIVPKNNSVGVMFTGLMDRNGNSVACYAVRPKDDSYGDGSYPVIIVAADVDLADLAPIFVTDDGVNLYVEGGKEPEKSRESFHDFSKGTVHYTAGSESKKEQRNIWLSVVKAGDASGMTYNLYTNSLSDENADTRIDNGVIYSKREVILTGQSDDHDIFLINMGTNVIPGLSAELASETLQIDEYWTLSGNHDLAGFSGTADTTEYGELANMAKVRLKIKDGVTSGEAVEGTLTIKAAGTTIMVLELTGIAGTPIILTDSIPEAVKYVPYGTIIQNSNKYKETKVRYALGSGKLPAGMEVMENGEIYGVPQEAGTFRFTVVMVTTNPNSNMSRSFTLVVKENTDENVDAATDEGYDVTQRIPSVAIGSTDKHTFVSQGVLDEFTAVYLDGEELVRDVDYTAESGSTRLTISSQTLTKNKSVGAHTLGVEFRTSGEGVLKAAAQNFNVVKAGTNTGDGGSSGNSGDSGSSGNTGDSDNGLGDMESTGGSVQTAGSRRTGYTYSSYAVQNTAASAIQDTQVIIYTIVSGDTLSKIAFRYYGDASLWKKIYEDNRDVIQNPHRIRVGWQIKIYPINMKTGSAVGNAAGTYVVQRGDSLWRISQKMYGRGWQWGKIYDANKAVLPTAKLLQVGQVLVIP